MNFEMMWCTLRKTLDDFLMEGFEVDLESVLMLMDYAETLSFIDEKFCGTWLNNWYNVNKREFCE